MMKLSVVIVAALAGGATAKTQVAPVAGKGCTALTRAERADVVKRVLAWIDAQHPTERGAAFTGADPDLVMNVGCKEASGAVVVDVSQDREPAKPRPDVRGTRRNYVLRASSASIAVIAEDESTPSQDWMEWADEGRISLLAQLDLDGDGALDVVYSDHEHEGGAVQTADHLHVRYGDGKVGESARITNLFDVQLVANQLILAGATSDGDAVYACLGGDLHLAPCAASASLQRAADRRTLAERAAAGVAVPAPTPADRVQRQVTAFLVKAKLIEPPPMADVITQTNPAARRFLDDLAVKLGDTACSTVALTADDQARATAWVRAQDAKASDVTIQPSVCGPYVWVAWWPTPDSDKRRQVLLGRDGTRILGFTYDRDMEVAPLDHDERWFTHDGTVVGIAIGGQNLWVIVDAKVVTQSKGDQLAFYHYDDRWAETASDVFVDGGTLWHATPTGRERLPTNLVRDHEARRAAIALVSRSTASSDAKYVAALQLLGADKALIAACERLPQ